MYYIDTHAHVHFEVFDDDRDAVMKRTLDSDTWVINVGTKQETSKQAVELAQQYDNTYAIIGLHPIETPNEDFDYDFYKHLAQDEKVVAVGECGLDYFRLDGDSKEKQKEVFVEQIQLANELNKPLMLHIRPGEGDAYGDAIALLKEHAQVKGTAHFFAGTTKQAQAFFDMGFYVSFSGVVTFAKEYEEVVKHAPLDRILSETDCPYVAPAPHRGKRNEPIFVQEVVKKIAELKELPLEEVQKQLLQNAKTLFSLS